MAPSPQHSARKLSHSRLLLLALLCVAGTACGTTAQSNKVLFEDPRGTVSLQTISDQAIQASHPIDLEPALIARVLSGMQVQPSPQIYEQTMTGEAITPVFLPEEVQFLAPRIAKALTTAATGEAVAFLITSPHPGTGSLVYMETTAGSLYAYDRSLYVTLSQYRYDPIRAHLDLTSQALPRRVDVSGLRYRTLLFTPSAALRSDTGHRPEGGAFTDRFLAIDYQLLQHASPAVATTNAPDAPSHTTEALVQEVDTLKKALQSVQQQLDSLTTRGQSSVSP
jgi:hypothetical protein